jgi:hypothetical protein
MTVRSGDCVDCVDIGAEYPWERHGRSLRCAPHRGAYKRWQDRTSKAARRMEVPLHRVRQQDPYEPQPIAPHAGERLLSARTAHDLDELVVEVRRKREVLDNALRSRRTIHPASVAELLTEVGYLCEAIDRAIWPE